MPTDAPQRIELKSVPRALCDAMDTRRSQLGISSRSGYLRSLAEADCARAGLWPPGVDSPPSKSAPTNES